MVKMSILLKNQLLEKVQESKGLTDKEYSKFCPKIILF